MWSSAAPYSIYQKHGSNYDYYGNGTAYAGMTVYSSDGSYKYVFNGSGGGGGTQEQITVLAKSDSSVQTFAFDGMDDIE